VGEGGDRSQQGHDARVAEAQARGPLAVVDGGQHDGLQGGGVGQAGGALAQCGQEAGVGGGPGLGQRPPVLVVEGLGHAGFEDIGLDRTAVPLRISPPAEFFWQYVRSTPLAAVVAELDPEGRAALEREVVERCQPFVDGDATVMEPGLLLATARTRSQAL
jgi:hypothetical protein